jgi:hypothetical protein
MNTVFSLLANSLDYAGLFPPAKLSMRTAVENYAMYVSSEHSWMLGRFVLPISSASQFIEETADLLPAAAGTSWHITAILNQPEEVNLIASFNSMFSGPEARGHAVIDMVEVRTGTVEDVERTLSILKSVNSYLEIPIDRDPLPLISAIRLGGSKAKIRTGGTSVEAFPSGRDIIRFMTLALEAGVPFKATAGLHHPLRARYRLTYETGSPTGLMFGFLNVLLAAAFLARGMDPDNALMVLEEQAPDAFTFDEDGVRWRGYHVETDFLIKVRRRTIESIGTCSFSEPVEELTTMGLIEEGSA